MLAPIIGMAQGCLDVFEERVKSRKDPLTMQPAIERTAPQTRFAEASVEVEAARLFMRHDLARLRNWGETGEITMEERAALRRNVTYGTTLCARAANRLVDGMDSSALYESNLLHRFARDVRAGALQFALAWDESAVQYSRVKWGLEPQTVII
jgi:alkylation response protein AidB-like acyl-CoA dehydrogenase